MHTVIFFSIFGSMIVANVLWWRHADRLTAKLPRPRLWRVVVGAWSLMMALVVLLVILSRVISPKILDLLPQPVMAAVYIWHVLFAIEWLAWRVLFVSGRAGVRRWRWPAADHTAGGTVAPVAAASAPIKTSSTPVLADSPAAVQGVAPTPDRGARQYTAAAQANLSVQVAAPAADRGAPASPAEAGSRHPQTIATRRQFLAATAIAAPPVLASLAAWRAVSQFDQFRTTTVTLAIPNLPRALQGLRIAHVSDIHIGKFTDDALLKAVVERTNALRPDLVLFTGDMIDFDLADLPAGLSILRRWDPKFGLCVCEGNHDLIAGRAGFERQMRQSGFPMPLNGSHSVTVRGQEVQLLGLRWGGTDLADMGIASSDRDIANSVRSIIPQIRPGAFPILLAHHPHAFDYLGDAPIPLVLSGHTHGGQINLGPIHPALLRFRYLSGLYHRPGGKQMFVSNGVGNWFPLRINAPAEIGEITLRSA